MEADLDEAGGCGGVGLLCLPPVVQLFLLLLSLSLSLSGSHYSVETSPSSSSLLVDVPAVALAPASVPRQVWSTVLQR